MVAAGVAAFCLLENLWVPAALGGAVSAVLLWLGGFWVGPRTRDAYVRRVMYAWEAWATEADWANSSFSARESRYHSRIERLPAPQSYRAEHERLLAMLSDAERTLGDRSIAPPDRVRQSVAAVRALSATVDELCATAAQADERQFCQALKQAREERRTEYRTATQRAERATEKLLAKLARLRPPSAAHDVHAQVRQSFQGYLEALQQFHAACRDGTPEEAAHSATSLGGARVALQSSARKLRESLGYNERWPSDDIDDIEP